MASSRNANEPLLGETTSELGSGLLPRRTRVVFFTAPIRQQHEFLKNVYGWLFLATLIIAAGAAYPSLPEPGPVGEYLKDHEWPMWASLGAIVAACVLVAFLEPHLRQSPYDHVALWTVVLLQALFAAAVSAAYSTAIPAVVMLLTSGFCLLASFAMLQARDTVVDAALLNEPAVSVAILGYMGVAVLILAFWQHVSWLHIFCTVGPATLLVVYLVRQVRGVLHQRPAALTSAPLSYAPFGGDLTVEEHVAPVVKSLHEPFTLFIARIGRPWLDRGRDERRAVLLEAEQTV